MYQEKLLLTNKNQKNALIFIIKFVWMQSCEKCLFLIISRWKCITFTQILNVPSNVTILITLPCALPLSTLTFLNKFYLWAHPEVASSLQNISHSRTDSVTRWKKYPIGQLNFMAEKSEGKSVFKLSLFL